MDKSVVSNVYIYGLKESVVASGYPMRSDDVTKNKNSEAINKEIAEGNWIKALSLNIEGGKVTERDWKRANTLADTKIGEGHDNFLNGVIVQFDLTLSVHAWKEAERYHFLDFVSSQSTMHKLDKMDLNLCCMPYVDEVILERMKELQKKYQDSSNEEDWLKLIYSYPSGLCLTARMTTNYRQLKTIYRQRRLHRLPEWQEFCDWIETLPHAEWIMKKEQ